MAFINSYRPPSPPATLADPYGPDPYDVNFCFPVPAALKTPLLTLIPLIPRAHADAIWNSGGSDQSLYRYILSPMRTKEEFLARLRTTQQTTGKVIWLILDTTKEERSEEVEGSGRGGPGSLGGRIAGWLGYCEGNPAHGKVEIGPIIVLPAFQRSHVATHAVGLLIQYALNLPSDLILPGLGLRRVEWSTEAGNTRSIATAQRLGFKLEATHRWMWILSDTTPEDVGVKFERRIGERDEKDGVHGVKTGNARHDAFFSICWDDWENGGRAVLETQIARQS